MDDMAELRAQVIHETLGKRLQPAKPEVSTNGKHGPADSGVIPAGKNEPVCLENMTNEEILTHIAEKRSKAEAEDGSVDEAIIKSVATAHSVNMVAEIMSRL